MLPRLPDMTHDPNPPVECETDDEPPMDDLFRDVFVSRVENPPSVHDRIQTEVSSYKAEDSIALHNDPLEWWKTHQSTSTYPILSRMGIPATSFLSERVFSAAGENGCVQRSSLTGNNVDMRSFLKSNFIIKY